MKKIKFTLILVVVMGLGFSAKAQADYRMQSLFVFNFTRMVAWPQEYTSGDFILGVYGRSPILDEFNDLANSRSVGNQSIIVRQFSSIDDISKCHVLYVPRNQVRNISEIKEKLESAGISALLISDHNNGLRNGAIVNFVIENQRQRYELSDSNAAALGLRLGGEMTRLAVAVK